MFGREGYKLNMEMEVLDELRPWGLILRSFPGNLSSTGLEVDSALTGRQTEDTRVVYHRRKGKQKRIFFKEWLNESAKKKNREIKRAKKIR